MTRPPLRDRARGRWRGLLPQLGIRAEFLTGRHCPCPMCGGKDRFMFDDKDGTGSWICHQCDAPQAGQGIALVMKVNGWPFKQAADAIEALIGTVPFEATKPERSALTVRAALNRLWAASSPIRPDDATGRFLQARVGVLKAPNVLRCHPRARYDDDKPSFHPAMVAMIQDSAGRPASLHRTYLTSDGRKAAVASPRRVMPGSIPKGSAVRLFPAGAVLGIAEGIETAFAAASLFGVPVWAALNSGMLTSWEPPLEAREIIVFGDNDPKFGGQAAAYALAHRLSKDRVARAEIPPTPGWDWNDMLAANASVAA